MESGQLVTNIEPNWIFLVNKLFTILFSMQAFNLIRSRSIIDGPTESISRLGMSPLGRSQWMTFDLSYSWFHSWRGVVCWHGIFEYGLLIEGARRLNGCRSRKPVGTQCAGRLIELKQLITFMPISYVKKIQFRPQWSSRLCWIHSKWSKYIWMSNVFDFCEGAHLCLSQHHENS